MASDEKLRNVTILLDKFDFGVRNYLTWIDSVKQLDSKITVKADIKSDLEKWRTAFTDVAKKTAVEISFSKDNTFELKYLSFTIIVRLNGRANVENVSLMHPGVGETNLDIIELLSTPQDVHAVMTAFTELLKSMLEAAHDDSTELTKIITGLMSIYNDIFFNIKTYDIPVRDVLSSRYGLIVSGKSCFLRPSFIYYRHACMISHSGNQTVDFKAHISFIQSSSSFSIQVAHNNSSDVFTYASTSGVYMLVLEQPVLMCFAIFRKLQDLCRSSGILHHLKSHNASQSSLPSMREATAVFPRALFGTSGTERIIHGVADQPIRLATSILWENTSKLNVFDPCHWLEAIPFCDTKSLSHIVHLLRIQQRFNSLLLNSCDTMKESILTTTNCICLPLNITVNSLTSFSLKSRHPVEAKFLTTTVAFPRENSAKFNEPRVEVHDLDSFLADNSAQSRSEFTDLVTNVIADTWSLSSLGAFVWRYFLPVTPTSTTVKREIFMDSSALSPCSQSESKANRRVSILEEILSESELAASALANNGNESNTTNNAVENKSITQSPPQNYTSPTRLIHSTSWLPNSSNVISFEMPVTTTSPAVVGPVRCPVAPPVHQGRGRPRKYPAGVTPSVNSSSSASGSVRSPASASGNSKKRLSLPPVNEIGEQDASLLPSTTLVAGKISRQVQLSQVPNKRGRRISTSPSASSPAFSMQPSPAMTPAFSFPSEYGGNEESEDSCVQSTPSDERIPPIISNLEPMDSVADDKDGDFPSPPMLMQEHPVRPGSEEDEKGLVICEPGGYDNSPGYDDYSMPQPANRGASATSLSRPSSSLSEHLRIGVSRGLNNRVLQSSDESEHSSSSSLPDEKTPSKHEIIGGASRYSTGIAAGFSTNQDSSRNIVQSPTSLKSSFNKPGTTKLLALNDIFMGGSPNDPASRQKARAALDSVLMKNRQDSVDDAFAFNERDPLPNPLSELKAAKAQKRPAPSSNNALTALSSTVSKPVKTTSGATSSGSSANQPQRQRTISDEQRPKQAKQRKIEDSPGQSAILDPSVKKEKARADSSKLPGSDFQRPLPTNMKIPKKGATVASTGTLDSSKTLTASKSGNGSSSGIKASSQSVTAQAPVSSAAASSSIANPLGSFRIPKKKDSAADVGGNSREQSSSSSSSSKRPNNLPVSSSSSTKGQTTPNSGSSGSFRQRTNSFDGSKEKQGATTPVVPEPTSIPLSASYPLMQKQPIPGSSEQQSNRSLQHHKSQPEFPSGSSGGDVERRKSNASQSDSSRAPSSSSSSSVRKTSSSGTSSSNNHRSSSGNNSSGRNGNTNSSASGQRSSYDNQPRRQSSNASSAVPSYTTAAVSTPVVESYTSVGGGSNAFPQPPPAHQRIPSSSAPPLPGASRTYPAHSAANYSSGDYSGSGNNTSITGGGGGGGGAFSSWYDNSLGGSNYRSFSDQPSGEAPIQSPEPQYGQAPFDNQPPVPIIATSPVRHHPPQSSHSSGNNFF